MARIEYLEDHYPKQKVTAKQVGETSKSADSQHKLCMIDYDYHFDSFFDEISD